MSIYSATLAIFYHAKKFPKNLLFYRFNNKKKDGYDHPFKYKGKKHPTKSKLNSKFEIELYSTTSLSISRSPFLPSEMFKKGRWILFIIVEQSNLHSLNPLSEPILTRYLTIRSNPPRCTSSIRPECRGSVFFCSPSDLDFYIGRSQFEKKIRSRC